MEPTTVSHTAEANYVVIDTQSESQVGSGFRTRNLARLFKRELEYKHKAANGFRTIPSRYYVETGLSNKNGAGIYSH